MGNAAELSVRDSWRDQSWGACLSTGFAKTMKATPYRMGDLRCAEGRTDHTVAEDRARSCHRGIFRLVELGSLAPASCALTSTRLRSLRDLVCTFNDRFDLLRELLQSAFGAASKLRRSI